MKAEGAIQALERRVAVLERLVRALEAAGREALEGGLGEPAAGESAGPAPNLGARLEGAALLAELDVFLVKVVTDGGVAGDATTPCGFTYAVKTLDGATTLKAAVTPKRARFATGKYTVAPENSLGLAAYDTDGATLMLLVAFGEVQASGVCSV